MNNAPRTEAAFDLALKLPLPKALTGMATFADKLECEADQLAKQCVKNVEEIGELRAALVISEKKEMATRAVIKSWKEDEGADAARLAWLIESCVIAGK